MPTNDVLVAGSESPRLTRTSKRTLQQQISDIIRERIRASLFVPGDKLPSVRELADEFSVSRETAKLSLDALKRDGVIEIIPSRGGFVLDVPPSDEKEKTGSFGFVIDLGDGPQPRISVDTIYEGLLHCVDREAGENHLVTSQIVFGDPSGRSRFSDLIDKIDGLFVTGLINPQLLEALCTLPIPVVSLLANLEVESIDEVGVNSEKTYARVTRYLLETGHRNLVYLDGPKTFYQQSRRIAGCKSELDLVPDACFSKINTSGWSPDGAYSTAKAYLQKNPETDAVLAVNDVFALGVFRACQDLGIRVPRDLSVVGAKNTLLSESSHPAMTSIEYHFDEIARLAVQRMSENLSTSGHVPVRIELVGTLVERQSTTRRKTSQK